MRIVTRPDFDGVVCAALLYETEQITEPVLWVEPNEVQHGQAGIRPGDILANLPYAPGCSMWFDHHYTNRVDSPFEGAYKIAPSAAGVIYEYYQGQFKHNYDELVRETDKIDAADLSLDEVLHPEDYPCILLSMTLSGQNRADEPYWNLLVELLRDQEIGDILQHPEVRQRCAKVVEQNRAFRDVLLKHTTLHKHVSLTDLRSFETPPAGNRFLVYSLFPDAVVSIKARFDTVNREKAIISVGHSIFNPGCRVNVGVMLSEFNGGGHRGAGACAIPADRADETLAAIVEILKKNKPNE